MGLAFDKKGEYNNSLIYYQKAIDNFMHTVGKEHPNLATAYHNIGLTLLKKGLLEECLEYLRKSLIIKKRVYDSMNTNLAHLYGSFAHAHKMLGNFTKSFEY